MTASSNDTGHGRRMGGKFTGKYQFYEIPIERNRLAWKFPWSEDLCGICVAQRMPVFVCN